MAEREAALEALQAQLDENAQEQLAAASSRLTSAAQYVDDEHILVVPGAGYRFVYEPGPAPEPGCELEVDGLHYRVLRIGRSSLPGDRRASAFLERL